MTISAHSRIPCTITTKDYKSRIMYYVIGCPQLIRRESLEKIPANNLTTTFAWYKFNQAFIGYREEFCSHASSYFYKCKWSEENHRKRLKQQLSWRHGFSDDFWYRFHIEVINFPLIYCTALSKRNRSTAVQTIWVIRPPVASIPYRGAALDPAKAA